MTPPVITALYAALCAFIVLALAVRIMVMRFRMRTGMGDGGDSRLARAIRIHGNAIEYVPIALVLLLVAELDGARPALLHGCGIVLVVAGSRARWGSCAAPGCHSAGDRRRRDRRRDHRARYSISPRSCAGRTRRSSSSALKSASIRRRWR
jgi:uncharacterized membrane protein YecN with MAPEG domain